MTLVSRQRLLGASAVNGIGFLIASAVAIGWWLLVTRLYPAEESGRLILAISVAGVINLLDLGASAGLVSLVSAQQGTAKPPFDARKLFKVALTSVLLVETIIGAASLAWWLGVHQDDKFLTAPVALLVLAFALSTQALQLCIGMLKGSLQFRSANLVSTGSTILVYGPGAMLVWLHADTHHVLAVMTAMQVVAAIASVRYASRESGYDGREATHVQVRTLIRTLLRTSLPFYPQMFTGIFFNHVQRFLIVRFVGLDAVAVLSLAMSIATRLHAVVNAFLEVLFPMAMHMRASGVRALSFCVRAGALAALAYGACAAAVVLVAHFGMPVLVLPFAVFALGVACSIAAAPAFHLLNGTGESWQVSLASALSPVTFLAAAVALHSVPAVSSELLLPWSYCCASTLIVLQILAVLVRLGRREHVVV